MNRNTKSVANRAPRPAPALRRAYFDCRYGQLHVYQAIPAGGGFDEATPVICLPGVAGDAAVFKPLLAEIGIDRSVFAIDLPGHGHSDGDAQASAAAAISDFLRSMRIRQANLLVSADAVDVVHKLQKEPPAQLTRIALWDSPDALLQHRLRWTAPHQTVSNALSVVESTLLLREFFDAQP
jgi:hypothetical protein